MLKLCYKIVMEKIIKDRINHLKSELADETRGKLTKTVNGFKVLELETRINELERVLKKHKYETSIK